MNIEPSYRTAQYCLYDGLYRSDAQEVERSLNAGARWDINQWGIAVDVEFGRKLVCMLLGRNRDFSLMPEGYSIEAKSLDVLGLMLKSWPAQWSSWDGPLIGDERLLHLCVQKNSRKVVGVLLECGADPNAVDTPGRAALHYAQDDTMIQNLLASGAVVNHEDKHGLTALDHNVGLSPGHNPSKASDYLYPLITMMRIYALAQATSPSSCHPSVKQSCQDLVSLLLDVENASPSFDRQWELFLTVKKYASSRRLQKLTEISITHPSSCQDNPATKSKL